MAETATKVTPPEGLTDAEVAAWKASLPEPAKEAPTTQKDQAATNASVEARLARLEELLNVKLEA